MKLQWLLIALLSLTLPLPLSATEPTVEQVRLVALEYSGLAGRADRWRKRVRARNLIPRVSARVSALGQSDDEIEFQEFLNRDAEGVPLLDAARNTTTGFERSRLVYSLHATIDLRGVVFDRDELAVARHARGVYERRAALIERVHLAYFRRLAVMDELAVADEGRRRLALELLELEAQLDGYTGGWFRRELQGGER